MDALTSTNTQNKKMSTENTKNISNANISHIGKKTKELS